MKGKKAKKKADNESNREHKSDDEAQKQRAVCVLTCPPEVRAVSNTKAYQSPLDVPPPPRNLTTRIKAKLKMTHSSCGHPAH